MRVLNPAISKGDCGESSLCLCSKSTSQDSVTAEMVGLGRGRGPRSS